MAYPGAVNLACAALAVTLFLGLPAADASLAAAPIRSVGSVSRHAEKFVNQHIVLRGYVLARKQDYVLFSDEPEGRIGRFDLPVTGVGIDLLKPKQRYVLEGIFLDRGLAAVNGNPDHFELSAPPAAAAP